MYIKFCVPGDFFGESKAVKFQPGEREKTFPVVALDDNIPEVSATLAQSRYFTQCLKKRAGVFYDAASFLDGFKNIPGKVCVNRVHNNYAFVNVGNKHTRKTPHTNEECFIS